MSSCPVQRGRADSCPSQCFMHRAAHALTKSIRLNRSRTLCVDYRYQEYHGVLHLSRKVSNFHMVSSSSSSVDRAHNNRNENITTRSILDYDAGPMVWVDLEMTGLNPKVDKIMEIAVSSPRFLRSPSSRTDDVIFLTRVNVLAGFDHGQKSRTRR